VSDTFETLPVGSVDPHYKQLKFASSLPDLDLTLSEGKPTAVTSRNYPTDKFGAAWIGGGSGPQGYYQVRTFFDLSDFNLSTVELLLGVGQDNYPAGFFLNGKPIVGQSTRGGTLIKTGFNQNQNQLDFGWYNNNGPQGIVVNVVGTGFKK
jgi:hypothetical protein